jgi:hypothetical protein
MFFYVLYVILSILLCSFIFSLCLAEFCLFRVDRRLTVVSVIPFILFILAIPSRQACEQMYRSQAYLLLLLELHFACMDSIGLEALNEKSPRYTLSTF